MSPQDQSDWMCIEQMVQEKVDSLRKELQRLMIQYDVCLAAVEIYKSYGVKHPCTYGAMESLDNQRKATSRCEDELESWNRRLQLVQWVQQFGKNVSIGPEVSQPGTGIATIVDAE